MNLYMLRYAQRTLWGLHVAEIFDKCFTMSYHICRTILRPMNAITCAVPVAVRVVMISTVIKMKT